MSFRQRLQRWWADLRYQSVEKTAEELYLRLVSDQRGVPILAGLRRYHDANGRWPNGLSEIKTLVPEQALIDPYTGQLLVYKRSGDGFSLYVIGPNQMDENGSHTGNADDWRIWPP